MAKKDLQYYRWQFLRRNEDYRNLLGGVRKKHRKLLNKVFNEQSPLLVELRGPITWDEPLYSKEWVDRVRKLRKKFSINGFFDPTLKPPPHGLKIYGPYDDAVKLGGLRKNFLRELQAGQSIKGAFLTESIKSSNPGGIISLDKAIEVSINCDASLEAIHDEIEKIIKPIQGARRKLLSLPRAKKAKKNDGKQRRDELENYLKIYDMRTKLKLKNFQVAKKLYPTKVSRYAEGLVFDQHKKAQELVQKGYKQILF